MQNTNHQYNLPNIGKKISYRGNREGVAERFADPSVGSNIAFDVKRIGFYDGLLNDIDWKSYSMPSNMTPTRFICWIL